MPDHEFESRFRLVRKPLTPDMEMLWEKRQRLMPSYITKALLDRLIQLFSGAEPGKIFAACLIITEGVKELQIEAREYLRRSLCKPLEV